MGFDPLFILIALACLAVVVVLMLGLGGFAKGSGWAKSNSNRLMRYRIAAQFVAVLLILAYVALRGTGN
ncbi:twin transmembrane helix small protein [uncultured Tateyamaria sp.]|uniref:twin transmembrane helix small protein n=1 Tax=uncultured Tateyamaria sp. TaxID=455651 RepID=UPI00260C1FA3|nr:twin transmembrane helix small protein [uncultured Tateyamaria sp.]